MKMIPLRDIATIDISNVDKKCKEDETEVLLCNFVDVYHNWAITKVLEPSLMRATANQAQIERFSIHKGQVAITKDSETRDDIGVPTFIADDIEHGILGYHCALITPDERILKGEYLNIILHSPYAQKYFEANASGSGQRYTLTTDIIGDFPVPIPDDMSVQDSFGKMCSDIDSKITNNNAICSNLEAMTKLLYDYWFVQFDFPDENGKPYKSSGGKMVWNAELKREIPAGWEVKPLSEYISVIRGISYKPTDELKQSSANSISLLKSNNIQNGTINFDQPVILPSHLADSNQWLTEGSVFITMSSGSKAHMGKTAIVYKDLPYVFGAFCAKIVIDDSVKGYLSTYFRSEWFRAYIENVTAGTSINNIGNDQLTNILLPFPGSDILKRFEDYLKPMFVRQGELGTETQQLASLRDFLLPMLMNGQIKLGKVHAQDGAV